MLIEGHNMSDLEFVGFYDTCLFKHNNESGGCIYKDKSGKNHYFSWGQLKKAAKTGEKCGKK